MYTQCVIQFPFYRNTTHIWTSSHQNARVMGDAKDPASILLCLQLWCRPWGGGTSPGWTKWLFDTIHTATSIIKFESWCHVISIISTSIIHPHRIQHSDSQCTFLLVDCIPFHPKSTCDGRWPGLADASWKVTFFRCLLRFLFGVGWFLSTFVGHIQTFINKKGQNCWGQKFSFWLNRVSCL